MSLVSGAFLLISLAVMALGSGSSILLYLLTFSFLTGLIGLILAIKHRERGKAIAIAAMVIPVTLLVMVIVALNALY